MSKCKFGIDEVEFLGFVLGPDGVAMEQSHVDTIQQWPEPYIYQEVQVFLGFANFYRRFIANYSKIAVPLTAMLKGSKNGKKAGSYIMTNEVRKAFKRLKNTFSSAPVLQHFDPSKLIRIEMDTLGFAIVDILSQLGDLTLGRWSDTHWHPVVFWSRKIIPAKCNYDTHDKELLAIVKTFKHWRHYLKGS